jgi:HK97 family phage prohead protease
MTEHALFGFELRDVEGERRGGVLSHLEGRAVPYNTWANVGGYMERFKPGAFAKSVKENGHQLPLMLFHGRDDLWPIGLATRWTSRDDGLYGVWRLNESPNAQRAGEMARSGELGFLSVGFVDIRSVPELVDDYDPALGEDHMDRITRIEARLVETSIVPTPAYRDAVVTCVRAYKRSRRDAPAPRLAAWRQIAAGLPRPVGNIGGD